MKESTRPEVGGGGQSRRWAARRLLRGWVSHTAPSAGAQRLDFDTLAQDLAQGVSRRRILRRLLGGAAASLAAPLVARLALEPAPAAAATSATAPAGACSSSKAGANLIWRIQ
jgi:hypothetical protein